MVDPLGARSTTTYNVKGQVAATIDPVGRTTAFLYDGLGRQTGIVNPLGAANLTAYNSADEVTATVDPHGLTTRFGYDTSGALLTTESTPDGATTTLGYTGQHLLSSIAEPGRGVSVSINALSHTLTTFTDAAGFPRTFGYDGAGHLSSDVWGPRSVAYTYDGIGNRKTDTANGSLATYSFNALNQYTQIQSPAHFYVRGTADPTAKVSIDGQLATRQGDAFARDENMDGRAQLFRRRQRLGGCFVERAAMNFGKEQGRHQITPASFFSLATSSAAVSTLTPAVRLAGSSTCSTVRRGAMSTP